MRHPFRSRSAILTVALVPLLVGAAPTGGPAHAEDEPLQATVAPPSQPFPHLDGMPRSSLSLTGEPRRASRPWVVENIHIKKGAGLGYTRPVQFGNRKMELGVAGPVIRKKKGLGLSFELRF